jgi:hypothetical protein
VVAIAGLTAIGWMATVNFLIIWDCKWLIVAFPLPWPLALALYELKQSTRAQEGLPIPGQIDKRSRRCLLQRRMPQHSRARLRSTA